MNWFISPDTLNALISARFPVPPYVLLFAGVFIIATSGLAFTAALMAQLEVWQQNQFAATFSRWSALQLAFPFTGLAIGGGVVLAALLMMAGLPILLSSLLALTLSVVVSTLAWSEIGRRMGHRIIRSYLAQQM